MSCLGTKQYSFSKTQNAHSQSQVDFPIAALMKYHAVFEIFERAAKF